MSTTHAATRFNTLQILSLSTLATIAAAAVLQYEIREYFRFVPSQYWPLKFALNYGLGILLSALTVVGVIRIFKKHKTVLSSVPLIILAIGMLIVAFIRQQTHIVASDNIIMKNNLYVELKTGEPLNGVYKSHSQWDGFGNGEHCTKQQYDDGIPTGPWMYSYKGDLIHSGTYLEPSTVNKQIQMLGRCQRVDINLWKEGNTPFLTLDLIHPERIDSTAIATIATLTIQSLHNTYQFKQLYIDNVSDNNRNTLLQMEVR